MGKKIEIESYLFLLVVPLFFLISIDSLFLNKIKVKEVLLIGWQKNGFLIMMNFVLFYAFNINLNTIMGKSNGRLTKKIFFKKIMLSPFFVMLILILNYWFFIPNNYYNKYLLILIMILYCYTGYRFLKKIEKHLMR